MRDLPPPTISGEAARDAAAEVLARPEYAGAEPSLLDRIVDRVSQAVGDLLANLTGTTTGGVLGYVALGIVVALVAVVVVRTVKGFRRDAVAGLATREDIGRGPEAWAADAGEHEAAGRWRDAIRCRYRELVAALAAQGVVEEVAGRTAGEYVTEVAAAAPDADEAFRAATGVFELAWYGDGEVGRDDLAALLEALGDIGVGRARTARRSDTAGAAR